MSEDYSYYHETRREMAELLISLRDLAENYTEADDLVGRILRGVPLSDVEDQREQLKQDTQKIRTKIEGKLRVSAVWTYSEHLVLRKIQDRSFWWVENLTYDESMAENYRKQLVGCIDLTLSSTDNLAKALSNSATILALS